MVKTQNIDKIFELSAELFLPATLSSFQHQAQYNPVYKQYLQAISVSIDTISSITEIPFLPIQFFKTHPILTDKVEKPDAPTLLYFESSGTTAQINSRHVVPDPLVYQHSFTKAFTRQYGDIRQYCILALLPSYLERQNSSLVYMVQHLQDMSGHSLNDFYLYDHERLYKNLQKLEAAQQRTLLIGVTYALLDFAEKYAMPLAYTNIIETGGMKGRREELIREEVHERLAKAFRLTSIHAEYGMTELLSQAYSLGGGLFTSPPWMKVLVRDINDPFAVTSVGKGLLNIIDLANIHSCCFIATDDIGEVFADGSFIVNGRLDGSDLRGCSLMVAH